MATADRDTWIEAGLGTLAAEGVHGVRVERLARDLGVTKGSFYWHFTDRAALLDALLAAWEARATDGVIARLEASGAPPADQLRQLVTLAFAVPPDLDRSVRAWASRDPRVSAVLAGVDGRRLATLERLFTEHGAGSPASRARVLYAALVGEPLLHPAQTPEARVTMALEALEGLLGP
ncbi:MAG: TetR/AcrR family transcriptional regulator [Myxococcales bacterium]|nr:TetR/AcrR family transcriptional regulator [Myxococcales bacterium]